MPSNYDKTITLHPPEHTIAMMKHVGVSVIQQGQGTFVRDDGMMNEGKHMAILEDNILLADQD